MTLRKYIVLFLLLTRVCLPKSQPFSAIKELETLDSLIKYNEFELVKQKADSLYTLLNNLDPTNNSLETKLELQFRKAIAYDRTYDHFLALELFLSIIDKATSHGYNKIAFLTNLAMALVYERTDHFLLCNRYLNAAYKEYEKIKSDELMYKYCIRRSSYYRFTNKLDSALWFAFQAEKLAIQNNILEDLGESNLLLGVLHNKINLLKANEYYKKAAHFFMKVKDAHGVSVMFSNISRNFTKTGNLKKALLYSDSAYLYYQITPRYFTILLSRSEVYEKLNQADSALFYFKKYHNEKMLYNAKNEAKEIKKLTSKYDLDKKEYIIKTKNKLLIFITAFSIALAFAVLLLFYQNLRIRSQNKLIQVQVNELKQSLDQKQVLLKELQHRVKNNLQQVMSILELQKESINHNNIEEIIRECKNRIQSMAYIHKKLIYSEDINSEVNLKEYLSEISSLVLDSYNTSENFIGLKIKCDINFLELQRALPLGLIVVELISNSIKYAFTEQHNGTILLNAWNDMNTNENIMVYSDNGKGFDFNLESKGGLGLEIIKGLIGQLNGRYEASNKNGFSIKIYF